MLISVLLMAATPAVAQPTAPQAVTCKVIKDSVLKSRRISACGTEAEWTAYRAYLQKVDRNARHGSAAYAGVGSGY
jgi:hypothetical protein